MYSAQTYRAGTWSTRIRGSSVIWMSANGEDKYSCGPRRWEYIDTGLFVRLRCDDGTTGEFLGGIRCRTKYKKRKKWNKTIWNISSVFGVLYTIMSIRALYVILYCSLQCRLAGHRYFNDNIVTVYAAHVTILLFRIAYYIRVGLKTFLFITRTSLIIVRRVGGCMRFQSHKCRTETFSSLYYSTM